MKKIGLLLLTTFGILFLGTTYANPTYRSFPGTCSIFENVRIDNYKLVAGTTKNERDNEKKQTKSKTNYYEPTKLNCIKCSGTSSEKIFLVDKSVDIKSITEENIETISIPLGYVDTYFCSEFYNTKDLYKIIKNGDTYEAQLYKTKDLRKLIEIKNEILPKFFIFWLLTIIIETSILFFITKLYYQDYQISNKKLFLFGILPTTITLPLLWFVLPLLIGDGIRYTIIGELLVTIIEAFIIKHGLNISRKRAIITSIICNLFSFILLSTPKFILLWEIALILSFILEIVSLFLTRKLLFKNDGISNKKLILAGSIALIVSIPSMIFPVYNRMNLNQENYQNLPILERADGPIGYQEMRLLFLVMILIKVFLDIIIIKYLLKISRKKSIITGIICNLFNLPTSLYIFYLILNIFFY